VITQTRSVKKSLCIIFVILISGLIMGAAPACDPTNNSNIIPLFNNAAGESSAGIEKALSSLVRKAEKSISAHFYSCNLYELKDALIDAHEDGIIVRFITDNENYANSQMREACYDPLSAAGIPILTDSTSAQSHNKFMVVDGKYVWTGSLNATFGSTKYQSNDVVKIESADLANAYEDEFNEMWGSTGAQPDSNKSKFGKYKSKTLPPTTFTIGGEKVELCFDPSDNCEQKMVDVIGRAKKTIDFAIFTFTSDAIADALVRASNRMVKVRGLFDSEGSRASGSEYSRLDQIMMMDIKKQTEIAPHADLIHHKLMIIDAGKSGAKVITGSRNWTESAESKNDENTLIIESPSITERYETFFEKIFCGDSGCRR